MGVPLLQPPALKAGARVAVIAPASSAKSERVDLGVTALRSLGLVVVEGRHLRGRSPQYFAGTVEERLRDLHWAFADASIDAVFCSRGGYGSNYLLAGLDLELIVKNAKPFFAYSDMTVLQNWILDRTGLVSFHGPMAAADFYRQDGVDWSSFQAASGGGMAALGEAEGLRMLRPGRASGTLYGGCLSMIVSMLGTAFAAETEGKLLFLEDVGTKPYQIDRMLRQLALAGKLDGVKGMIFGEMLDCLAPGADAGFMDEVILRVLDGFEGPIGIGLRSGHVTRANVTLPFGIEAELSLGDAAVLRMLRPAVLI